MSTSVKRANKRSSDPIDVWINDKGLRIEDVRVMKEWGSCLFRLSDGHVVVAPISYFPRLSKASKSQLEDWRLIAKGVGVHWNVLDEDVSLHGLLSRLALENFKREHLLPASLSLWPVVPKPRT